MEVNHLNLLLRLLFSHLLIDFVLQSNSVVQKKKEKKCFYHLAHSVVQALCAYAFVGKWGCWEIIPVIFCTHLLIDYWKVSRESKLDVLAS